MKTFQISEDIKNVSRVGLGCMRLTEKKTDQEFCFLLSAALVVFANLISDIVNAAIDPRIREEGIQDA